MVRFFEPQVILFVGDCERAAAFYTALGFRETYRGTGGSPGKIELALDGVTLGLALPGPAADSHQIAPVTTGHRACVAVWTDDVEAARRLALEAGARDVMASHPFLDGRLRLAIVEDLDGHPVQLVQRVEAAAGAVTGASGRTG